ncbi:hypothetical protein BH10ACT1_BH10ACT1_17670 [soil metagenome]
MSDATDHGSQIDASTFASVEQLRSWCHRVGSVGLRGTGSPTHEDLIAWIEDELHRVPGLAVRSESFDLLRWAPVPEGDLERAATLSVDGSEVAVAGAVPYSLGTDAEGPLRYLPPGVPITRENAAGAIVLRDFPDLPLPYDVLLSMADHISPDSEDLRGQVFDRPALADSILHDELIAAGDAGAAGLLVAFDLPRDQVCGYFEPHKGCHYRVPAAYVGVDERDALRAGVAVGATAQLAVTATASAGTTRNLYATLHGRSAERIVIVSHTDGNTWVQENGIAALLAMAHFFAAIPADERHHTIEFAFTSAHLHISREGGRHYAEQLDRDYEDGTVSFVFVLEHLGARELVPVDRTDGPGRRLEFTGETEPVLWAVGPSPALKQAVVRAIEDRDLKRIVATSGMGFPVEGQVPRIASFGGLGTYFHTYLVPTTSIITAPWSLWAPAFGEDAIDFDVLRQQALAATDVVRSLDGVARDVVAGAYLEDRRARAAGAPTAHEPEPPETTDSSRSDVEGPA